MKADLVQIVTNLMEAYEEYDDIDIIKGIKSLINSWPNLTEEEKKRN